MLVSSTSALLMTIPTNPMLGPFAAATLARFSLAGPVLPLVNDTLPIAEALRNHLLAAADSLSPVRRAGQVFRLSRHQFDLERKPFLARSRIFRREDRDCSDSR